MKSRKVILLTMIFGAYCSLLFSKNLMKLSLKEEEFINDVVVKIKWEKVENAEGYNIYRSENGKDFKKINLSIMTEYVDSTLESEKNYFYKVASFGKDGKETALSVEKKITTGFSPRGVMDIYPRKFKLGDKITVYFSTKKSKEFRKIRMNMRKKDETVPILPKKMFIRYGYNNWDPATLVEEGKEPQMTYDEESEYWKYEMEVPTNIREIDIAFYDEYGNKDNNLSKDYVLRATESDEGIFFKK